jgi:hypothetical protein
MNRGRVAPDVAGILIPVAEIVKRIPNSECKRMYTDSWRCVRAHLRGFLARGRTPYYLLRTRFDARCVSNLEALSQLPSSVSLLRKPGVGHGP